MNDKIEIEVEAKGIDEMNEKMEKAINNAEDLQEALDFPSFTIKQCKHCTFNLWVGK